MDITLEGSYLIKTVKLNFTHKLLPLILDLSLLLFSDHLLPPGVFEAIGGNVSLLRGTTGTALFCSLNLGLDQYCNVFHCNQHFTVFVPQLCDVGGRRGDLEHQLAGRDPQLSSIIPDDNPSSDLELHWQDLLDIMEPEVIWRRKQNTIKFGKAELDDFMSSETR